MIVLYTSASDSSWWEPSHITNLAPGQSSDGYTKYEKLGKGASNTSNPYVYKKVCTVTCMAANTPTWNWAADGSSCTATFTCSANSSLTATVNADVTTSGGTATASVTFNGTSYTVTNYNITYVLNGGKNASGNPSTYADNVGVSSFAAPTRKHYTFGGWYDNAQDALRKVDDRQLHRHLEKQRRLNAENGTGQLRRNACLQRRNARKACHGAVHLYLHRLVAQDCSRQRRSNL